MAKYLRTSSITSELENLIRDARKELYIISPYLKLSDNIKELLNDKEREKVDVRIIFGKQELAPAELSYLEGLKYVRLYFSKNLHAKCYLNESKMIIASMNLYEFSQQHNREMGILIDTSNTEDKVVYDDASKDIDSIIHNSEDFSYAKVPQKKLHKDTNQVYDKFELQEQKSEKKKDYSNSKYKSTSALSKIIGISSNELFGILEEKGWIKKDGKSWILTKKGEQYGGQMKKGQYGKYAAWPEEIIEVIDDLIN